MWFRVQYMTYAGEELWATFSARDPAMVADRLRELQIDPLTVERLWIDTGEGWERWHPGLLMEILRDARGA